MAKKTPVDLADLQRRLAAVGALCTFALTSVRLKMGDSAKLYRAEDDLAAAVLAISQMQTSLADYVKNDFAEGLRAMAIAHARQQKVGLARRGRPGEIF